MKYIKKSEDTHGDSWKCPFFHKVLREKDIYRLTCEGCIIKMPTKEAMQRITDKFCNASYDFKECPIYQSLEEHYSVKYGGEKE